MRNELKNFPLSQSQIEQGIEEGFDVILPDHYEALFSYFCNNGEMPYGTAKARDGDPDQWIVNKLDEMFIG